MKRIKFRVFCFLCIGILLPCSCFIGCGYGDQPVIRESSAAAGGDMPDGPKTGKVRIQIAQWSVSSDKLVEEAVNDFNGTNRDNINIEVLKIPSDRYIETLNMLNASGKGPDVFEIIREWLKSYVAKGWVADLSSYAGGNYPGGFPPWVVEYARSSGGRNGKLYAIPSNYITYRLIYNKDLFKEAGLNPKTPPRTLSDLAIYARKISEAEIGKRKYGIAVPMGEAWVDFVQPMEASNCYSGIYFYNFKEGKYDLTVYKPWLDTIKSLSENGGLFPGSDTMKSSQAMAQFADGNIGMMYVSSWEASLLIDQFPPKCNWGVALPPAINEASLRKGAVKTDMAGWNTVNAFTQYPGESVKVLKFLYSHEYLAGLSANGLFFPVVNDKIPESDILKAVPQFKEFLPGRFDAVYPTSPMDMEEWARKNIYLSALSGNRNNQGLLEESNRLNALLDTNTNRNLIDMNQYRNPDFNPLNPLKQNR